MGYLLRGSCAIDTILVHKGAFETRILPSEISRLNVCFGVDGFREEAGGTAGNISHNAALLGDAPLVNASVGSRDGGFWQERLESKGLSSAGLFEVEGEVCARAWILTDQSNNQITGFMPGALARVAPMPAGLRGMGLGFAHLAPDSAASLAYAMGELACEGMPYFLDPGQALPDLLASPEEGADFETLLVGSSGLFVNDYEAELCAGHMGTDFAQLASGLRLAVRTMGSKGSQVFMGSEAVFVPSCRPLAVADPTGCGDAFRAGFLHGVLRGWDPVRCARLGSVMGSFAVESSGGQNHGPTMPMIMERFVENFGKWA